MDARAGVRRAGATSDESNSGATRQLAVGIGHIGDAAFLSADEEVNVRGVVQRVEHGEEAFAGNGEDAVAALDLELVDEDAAAGALGHGAALAARACKGLVGPSRVPFVAREIKRSLARPRLCRRRSKRGGVVMRKLLIGPVLTAIGWLAGSYYGAEARHVVQKGPNSTYEGLTQAIDGMPHSGTTSFEGGKPMPYEIKIDRSYGKRLYIRVLFEGREGATADIELAP